MKGKPHRAQRTLLHGGVKQIVVFTEGRETEPSYLEYWGRVNAERVQVVVRKHHGVPWSLVEKAVEELREERALRREGVNTEYWCVFDRDDHPRFLEAIQRAEASGVKVAVTNPCIELWFILHFEDQNRHIERDKAQKKSKQLLGWKRKRLGTEVLDKLRKLYPDAKVRAQYLDRMHAGDGRRIRSNPSSEVWKLVDQIKDS